MNILFICKYNSFRSKGVESFFKKHNKNNKLKVKSAGLITGYKKHPNIHKATQKLNIDISGRAVNLTIDLLKWHDIIILVADDVPLNFFTTIHKVKKIIHWKIADAEKETVSSRVYVLKKIDKKIRKLVNDFKEN
jgi:protein-tyrosine-phosphatase